MNKLYILPQPAKYRIREAWVMALLFIAAIAQIAMALGTCAGAIEHVAPTASLIQFHGEELAKQAHNSQPTNEQDAAAFPSPAARG